jgi:hypothetical protein
VLGVAAQLFIEHSSCINVLLALGAVAVYTKRREKSAAGISGIWLGICAADFLNFLFIIVMNIWLRKKVLSTWS